MRSQNKDMKILMIEMGISQTQLAVLSSVHRATINGIANGRIVPSIDQAARIAKALRVKPQDLFPESN